MLQIKRKHHLAVLVYILLAEKLPAVKTQPVAGRALLCVTCHNNWSGLALKMITVKKSRT